MARAHSSSPRKRHYHRVNHKNKRPLIRPESVIELAKKDKAMKERKRKERQEREARQAEEEEINRREQLRAQINQPTRTDDSKRLSFSAELPGLLEGLLLGIVLAVAFYLLFLFFPVLIKWIAKLLNG